MLSGKAFTQQKPQGLPGEPVGRITGFELRRMRTMLMRVRIGHASEVGRNLPQPGTLTTTACLRTCTTLATSLMSADRTPMLSSNDVFGKRCFCRCVMLGSRTHLLAKQPLASMDHSQKHTPSQSHSIKQRASLVCVRNKMCGVEGGERSSAERDTCIDKTRMGPDRKVTP